MKAIVYTEYGSPDVLQLAEVEKPKPKDDEVLVKVHATSVNAADLDLLKGVFLIRLGGFQKPQYKILGSDIAGRVEAVGSKVTRFQVGDEVFGDLTERGFGAFAEYVCVSENALGLKPKNLTFEEAASVPSAGVIALQGLRRKGQIHAGQKVLINGAGGSVGTFAVQIAKHFGAEVTGVDSAKKLDMLRSLGADYVIDYTQEDFTRNGQQYDLILDVVAHRSVFDYRRALSANGVYVMIGGSTSALMQCFLLGKWISKADGQQLGVLMVRLNLEDLNFMKDLLEAGHIKPVIDRCYPLNEVAEAFRQLEAGRACGKIVITMA